MSRGPGVWQRRILERLMVKGEFALLDILPWNYTEAQYQAAWRAAKTLARQGNIEYLSVERAPSTLRRTVAEDAAQ